MNIVNVEFYSKNSKISGWLKIIKMANLFFHHLGSSTRRKLSSINSGKKCAEISIICQTWIHPKLLMKMQC
jgi:hypothetical protein